MSDEQGWVIERDYHSQVHYWTGRTLDPFPWSPEVDDALRFARPVDATNVLQWQCQGQGRVVEHRWPIGHGQ